MTGFSGLTESGEVGEKEFTRLIIGCAMTVHRELGPGFLESVYRNALAHELRKSRFTIETEKHLTVHYDDLVVGHFSADILVNDRIILELKAAAALSVADSQQLVNYLKATGLDTGLLINFGSKSLEFRRKQRSLPSVNPLNPVNPV